MSLRRDRSSWFFVGILLIIVAFTAYYVVWPYMQSHTTMRLGDGIFRSRIVTDDSNIKQLDALPPDKAVVRVYNQDERWAVNMNERDETFDIIWLDKDKKVVHIVKNASSASLPTAVFTSKDTARYVVELRGGTVDQRSIRIDSTAVFDNEGMLKVRSL